MAEGQEKIDDLIFETAAVYNADPSREKACLQTKTLIAHLQYPCKICNETAPPECREMCGELAIFRTVTDLHDKASGKHYTEVTTVVGCVLQIQTRQTTSLTLIENALRLKKTIETAEELEPNEEFSPKESSC